jgi:nitrous oxide reductase accessory protein NosL
MYKLLLSVIFIINLYAEDKATVNFSKQYYLNYTKNDTGLVRHLKLYKYPAWVSKISLRNGKEVYFSSPKGMFEFYFHPGKWAEFNIRSERDFKELVVTDYFTSKPINAEDAFFVYGSSVTSPAGDDLVPFSNETQAKQFMSKNNGKRIMKFDKISYGLIKWLNDAL